MQIFYFLVILTTSFALPFSGELNDDSIEISESERKETIAAMRNPDLFDGDMLGVNEMFNADRGGIRGKEYKWRNATIPYVIAEDIDDRKRKGLNEAFAYFHRKTCVRFVPRTKQKDYIRIHDGFGCTSYVGKQYREQQPQPVSLGKGCHRVGTIMHELMHAVGFYHEHNRSDRDDYVKIHLENVKDHEQHNFQKVLKRMEVLYTQFDYDSIMIYESTAWSKNGNDTIVPLQEGVVLTNANYKTKMAKSDIEKINKMYKCQV
ncbi:astacin-like metalloprotease toxin 5 [Parasteatoda tepidariorum]|uniref:astacin-like metalloprotease toxin 5 n=1 Tax=Parasteatoda tepidariorum TaxID=114398 RepID=UPI00077FB92D|nr:astacin-like metalloprotease toxin 5 [Parasteatoda tepidariorum]